ncbi:hypothetical protein ABH940_000847 [Streptacidiphilus sp. BW17]|uniref:hypothetical protein n=1 Tax=Streptacidiphilus sp. BW17 TaxID=3156274 RepID=UPI003515AC5C
MHQQVMTLATGTINPNHPATMHGFASVLLFLFSLVFLVPAVILLVKLPRMERKAKALGPGLVLLVLGALVALGGIALL